MSKLKKKIVKNKKILNAKQVISVDGIKFRSKLEEFTYVNLLKNGITNFDYEKHKFVLQESFNSVIDSFELKDANEFGLVTNKIREMTYKPDFVYLNDNKEGWIIECKGFSNDAFPLRWKLFKKFLNDNNYKVTLFKPNTQKNVIKCIDIIKNKYNNVQNKYEDLIGNA